MGSTAHEPAYLCLDARAAKLVRRLPDEDRLLFFDQVVETYLNILDGQTEFSFPDSLLGDVLHQAAETILDGFGVYMKRVNARSGKKNDQWSIDDGSVIDQRPTSDGNQDHPTLDHSISDQFRSSMDTLRSEGFDDDEITLAFTQAAGREVSDLTAYVRKSILNARGKKKILPAQDFRQRSYAEVDAELMESLKQDMKRFKATQREAAGG